ncbi:ATP-dependent 6-phosphofructokinase [Ignatzschineria sp. RMDPL8A]|uniref:6-phosphofructokinase n=1 Tax=Ignatzschineria sp. RMDPL8A TaxID=2999236 RepID=UPI0016BC1021|nr:ATP-dependent 6-phosphofructokinase [Ignatzschineria sp. RMDPL8A]MDG9729369.1 ATP-dependent 6-phosphofructokinase [Ignatzschineria sp. RMDPL8A]NLD09519.1 ATP-dependent 6-phosphofructokinase [Xanthomonadaceae bacterium]
MANGKHIGILTAGGDCQGLNAALRGVTLSALKEGWKVTGINDGFVGLAEMAHTPLTFEDVYQIAGTGGTILGTGRGGGRARNTEEAVANCVESFKKLELDALVCLGGDGTQRFASYLHQAGIPVVTLPKTIDNDIAKTDVTFGYDTAVHVSVMALDRLRTTADSHHRLMILEVMGRDAGWLAAGAALGGSADICLIPEMPYSMESLVKYINKHIYNKRSALLVIAEGAVSEENHALGLKPKKHAEAIKIVDAIPELTGMQARLTTLGYVSRGGVPTASDRIFATQCGTKAIELIKKSQYGVMVAQQNGKLTSVPIEEVAGKPRLLPRNHSLIKTMLDTGVCMGI